MRARLLSLVLLVAGCAASPPPGSTPAPGGASRAPYDSPPVAPGTITITLDLRAAREILALLSRPRFDAEAAKSLESLPAVEAAVRESNRPAAVFQADLAAAFDDQARIAIFDFRAIRENAPRWTDLLAMIAAREAELTTLAADRARALLPPEPPVSVTEPIYLTFGLPGRADHVVVPAAEGSEWFVVVDLARALSDAQSSPPSEQIKHLSRLMASEAYQRAWAEYRSASPAWQKRDPALGQLEPLLRRTAEAGPVALFSVDENFFPLSLWLKEPMRSSLDELNRVADRLVSAEGDLDARVSLAAETARPEFMARVAGPAGAFLADGIIQTLGLDAYRAALAGGPRAFFEAYDRAAQQRGRALIPLGKAIRERLAASAAPPKG
ncbi:MAG: hypothetical protein WEB59_05095 [Thermoanaerobaculia bacterium]